MLNISLRVTPTFKKCGLVLILIISGLWWFSLLRRRSSEARGIFLIRPNITGTVNRKSNVTSCDYSDISTGALFDVSKRFPKDFILRHRPRDVLPGGMYAPSDCDPGERIAIIIPYRDRELHLKVILNYLHMFLQIQKRNYRIFVSEMVPGTKFNKALLMNVGFLTAEAAGNYDCYIFHDVDLLPVDVRNIYTCGDHPRHLISFSTKYVEEGHPTGWPYAWLIGGALAFRAEHFRSVNGYSNGIFGWGGEDDDMYYRLTSRGMLIERVHPTIGQYYVFVHKHDRGNPKNKFKKRILATSAERSKVDGLSSIADKYSIVAIETLTLYTRILVNCSEERILEQMRPYLYG
ncbi:beta-1,4-N-acetylgalactosaminyltransferase bre-4-like [Dreissena polymorpha]|uniref:Beta-1,4-galactosyltransferase n=1 Tax=Dreissena polymorpha TaxID=45954 RepID=A0A9D4I280_DREPO|nr:beta-1,4-N-acetylgalactosaminyltransferase bre-4-like [Dreissena polymorpha]KAH3741564.1 hypothetical protein DPMN_048289 [Dreissena polymorpha]